MKFGIVGVIAFVIDWGILNLLVGMIHMHNVLAATISFSLLADFQLSGEHEIRIQASDDMARWMEIALSSWRALIGCS